MKRVLPLSNGSKFWIKGSRCFDHEDQIPLFWERRRYSGLLMSCFAGRWQHFLWLECICGDRETGEDVVLRSGTPAAATI